MNSRSCAKLYVIERYFNKTKQKNNIRYLRCNYLHHVSKCVYLFDVSLFKVTFRILPDTLLTHSLCMSHFSLYFAIADVIITITTTAAHRQRFHNPRLGALPPPRRRFPHSSALQRQGDDASLRHAPIPDRRDHEGAGGFGQEVASLPQAPRQSGQELDLNRRCWS